MARVLNRGPTEYGVSARRSSRAIGDTWIAAGALVVLVGAYLQFARSGWWFAHFSESYYLWSYIVGGLILAAGFGAFTGRALDQYGRGSTRVPWSR